MFLPYRLTPHLITLSGYKKGSTQFTATVLLGTGHMGSHKMKHTTVTRALQQLTNRTSQMTCVVVYADAWYHPWSRLCVKEVDLTLAEK